MPKETSIPLTKSLQNILFFQGVVLFSVTLLLMALCFRFSTIITYAHSYSRVPEYNGGGLFLRILFMILVYYSGRYMLNITVYHFQLHADVLIITSQTILKKKRDFFEVKKIKSISLQKEQQYPLGKENEVDYEITVLQVDSSQGLIKYRFPVQTNYYDLKALKEVLKDFI